MTLIWLIFIVFDFCFLLDRRSLLLIVNENPLCLREIVLMDWFPIALHPIFIEHSHHLPDHHILLKIRRRLPGVIRNFVVPFPFDEIPLLAILDFLIQDALYHISAIIIRTLTSLNFVLYISAHNRYLFVLNF